MENEEYTATVEQLISGKVSEELSQMDPRDEVLGPLGKLKTSKILGLDGTLQRGLKQLECETVDLLTSIHNFSLKPASVSED